jgi:hypothetical protein
MLLNQCIEKDRAYLFIFVANCNARQSPVIRVNAAGSAAASWRAEDQGFERAPTDANRPFCGTRAFHVRISVIFDYKLASILTARMSRPIKNARRIAPGISHQ